MANMAELVKFKMAAINKNRPCARSLQLKLIEMIKLLIDFERGLTED